MKGIDVYEGNNIQDWNVIRQQGIEVIIQKATQGTGHVDKLLQYRYPRIKAAGLKIGFYHFANNTSDPQAQADHFINTISGLTSDTVLWLDIEDESKWNKQAAISFTNAFITYVQSKGYSVGVYTGTSFYIDYLHGNIPDIPLWLASYGKQPSLYPSKASWQYSESGQLSGAVGNVDLDYFIDNIFIKKEEKELKNLVCVNNQVDARAGAYLADHLTCPIIDLSNDGAKENTDFSKVEHVYFVGGGSFPNIANSTAVKGNDRFDTVVEVLKTIGKIGR